MSGKSFNRIFAAVLVAGIVAMLSGFVAKNLVHAEELKTDAVAIEGESPAETPGSTAKAGGPEPILAMIAAADLAKGEKLSKACAACHSFDKGGANKVGPNLWGIVGANKAHASDCSYSAGMAGKGGRWTYADLNHFFWKPKDFVSGTKMTYAGLKKPDDRAAVIAWLRTLSDSPAAIPSDADIAAEKAESGAE